MNEPANEPAKQRWSSRKFWSVMFWEAVATGLLIYGAIDQSVWETITMFLIPAYIAGNVAQRMGVANVK